MRFRLRTFLIGITLCNIIVGTVALFIDRRVKRRDALRYLQLHAVVQYSKIMPDGEFRTTEFPEDFPVKENWFSELFLDPMPDVAQVGTVYPVRHLMFEWPKGQDKPYRDNPGRFLKELHRLRSIRRMNLSGSLLANAHIIEMPAIPSVEHLEVAYTDVDDGVVDALCRKFPNLTFLNVKETCISDSGIVELHRRLPKCTVSAGTY